nr:MAG TPA: hypothetical protein [Caudoviricetes sp.]
MKDYQRLTIRHEDGSHSFMYDYNTTTPPIKILLDRLAELEDKIENGTLVECIRKDGRDKAKDIIKCKFYSDYICNHYGNGLCHYAEKVFGHSLPDSCNHIDDFENCTCFEPIEAEALK